LLLLLIRSIYSIPDLSLYYSMWSNLAS
jgi:hypothetical protein